MKKQILFVSMALVAIVGATASTCDVQKSAPEPQPSDIVTGKNTQVIQMPEGFRNVGFTCYGVNGIYVTSRGVYKNGNSDAPPLPSGIDVVTNDPMCKN